MRLTVTAEEVRVGDRVDLGTGDSFVVKRRARVEVVGLGTLVMFVPDEDRLYDTGSGVRERCPSFGFLDAVTVDRELP